VPKDHWEIPPWINSDLLRESSDLLMENGVQYAEEKSYHQMCRWNSGKFYHHPALKDVRWYWRVEPGVHFFCDVDYDVFRYMEDNDKLYGFVINLYDSPESIETLWPQTLEFLAEHPEYIHKNNAMEWLTDSTNRPEHNRKANGYSTCHFWSNFEIADMNFWRSKPYEDYFEHLDRAGGFFYERWGDAPVHSIGLGLFADKNKIHWYFYPPPPPPRLPYVADQLTQRQVPRHRIPAHPLLQLSQQPQVQEALHAGNVHRRPGVGRRGLSRELV